MQWSMLLTICGVLFLSSTQIAARPNQQTLSLVEELILRGDYDRAISWLLTIEISSPHLEDRLDAVLLGARLYELVGKSKTSVRLLERFKERNSLKAGTSYDRIVEQQFRLLLEAEELEIARRLAADNHHLSDYRHVFVAREDREKQPYSGPNPWVAATFSSVLPGSGQIYQGRYRDALSSIFMIAIPSYFAVKAKKNDEHAFAAGAGTLAGFFYLGNVASAYRTAIMRHENDEKTWWLGHINAIIVPDFTDSVKRLGFGVGVSSALR